jgi:glycosyltransferase involved in cell wall biosynthesis
MSNPLFSIVIPTYNREQFISATLDTVINQTFQDYEIIIVDNASTDQTVKTIKPYLSDKVILIEHDRNYERAHSRNTGMKAAKGEYLTFLDSDDFMYPENLQDAYDFITANPNTKIFHNLFELVDQKRQVLYKSKLRKLHDPRKEIAQGNFLSCIGVFIHRDIYQSVLWDENDWMTGSEDYDYWLRVIPYFPNVRRIPKVNSGVLHHQHRTINNQEIGAVEARFKLMMDKWKKDEHFVRFYGGEMKNIASTLQIFLAGLQVEQGEYRKSLMRLLKIIVDNFEVATRRNYQTLFIRSLIYSIYSRRSK